MPSIDDGGVALLDFVRGETEPLEEDDIVYGGRRGCDLEYPFEFDVVLWDT